MMKTENRDQDRKLGRMQSIVQFRGMMVKVYGYKMQCNDLWCSCGDNIGD